MKKLLLLLLIVAFSCNYTFSQCADINNIYSFVYDSKTYEVVKENRTWVLAAACAVERGGKLAEVNDSSEQDAIFNELNSNAGIVLSNTIAGDGGGASYVWIGGNDIATEGNWVWDGNNDAITIQFWMGDASGNPVGGLYNNWGNEPDDFSGQDALALALTQWPLVNGVLGSAGQWNDLFDQNSLYYIIEYNALSIPKYQLENKIKVFPNPAENKLNVANYLENNSIKNIKIHNFLGQKIILKNLNSEQQIDISNLENGIYFLEIYLENDVKVMKKFIKK